MSIGPLRHRVDIEKENLIEGDFGGEAKTWDAVATVWAAVKTPSAGEVARSGGFLDQKSIMLDIRYRSDVEQGQRISWDGRIFHIQTAIDKEGRKRFLQVMATERPKA